MAWVMYTHENQATINVLIFNSYVSCLIDRHFQWSNIPWLMTILKLHTSPQQMFAAIAGNEMKVKLFFHVWTAYTDSTFIVISANEWKSFLRMAFFILSILFGTPCSLWWSRSEVSTLVCIPTVLAVCFVWSETWKNPNDFNISSLGQKEG